MRHSYSLAAHDWISLSLSARVLTLLFAFTLLVCGRTYAQGYLTAIGNTTFSLNVPVQQGYVNVANGDLHLTIPLGVFPQRGRQAISAELDYDSRIWQIVNTGSGNSWQPTNVPNSLGGWRFVETGNPGQVTEAETDTQCNTRGDVLHFGPFTWTAADGTQHVFPIHTVNDHFDCVGGGNPTGTAFANDSSGFYMSVANYTDAVVYGPDGSQIFPSYKDSNGNYFSTNSSGNIVDTLGRVPVSVITDCNGIANETCYNVLNAQGTTSQYIVTTESVSVSTHFGQSGVTEFSGTITTIASIKLPDGTTYGFSYDALGYGEIFSMSLPTLGAVSYNFVSFSDTFGNINRWLNTAGPSGGVWTFTPATVAPALCTSEVGFPMCQKLTVAKPNGDNVLYEFGSNTGLNGSFIGEEVIYSGASTPLETLLSTWSASSTSSQLMSEQTFRDDNVGDDPQKLLKYTYVSPQTPQIATISEWKSYTPGSTADRVTTFTWYSGGTNILDRPTSITVTNGAGTQTVAQTNITYDSYGSSGLISQTGIAQHDDTNFSATFTARGNATSIAKLVSGSTFLTTSMTYDTTGQVRSETDSNNNTTAITYTDSFYNDNNANPPMAYTAATSTNAYPTSVALPMIGAETFGYYYGTGQQSLSTDQNNATTYSHYSDSFNRLTEAILPDGGWKAINYNSETEVNFYLGITSATPSTSCASGCLNGEATTDNLGRPADTYLVSDPDGETTLSATTYDTNGRVSSVANPQRTTSNGQDTYTYDGLDRITALTHVDGTAQHIYYGSSVSSPGGTTTQGCSTSTYGIGYPVLTVDEAGKKLEVWTNGFGRTIEVDEPNSSGTLAENTCYAYDLNNNLLTAISATGQTRSFTYDAVSRMTSAAVPETNVGGTQYSTIYAYTNSGSLCSGNPSAVCVRTDGRGITATYNYDALNRLTKISYSDTTHTVIYCYDGSNSACISGGFSSTNGEGRRTSMSDGSGNTGWSYDTVGRIVAEQRTIGTITKTISYSYNKDGSLASITYPSGDVITYTTGNAERPLSAVDSAHSINYALLASYSPAGEVSQVVYGRVTNGFAGTTEARQYNDRLQTTSISASSSNGTAINLSPCYTAFTLSSSSCSSTATGNNGSVTGIVNGVDSNTTLSFSYDTLNRILSALTKSSSGTDCWGQGFGPDAVANLTSITVSQCSAGSLSASTDGDNHLTNTGDTYDDAGDMTGDGSHTYTYDAEERITTANGVTYTYDGDGLRVKKSNGTLYWRSITGDVLAETGTAGVTQNEYVFFAGRRIAQRITSSGAVRFYYADALGTIHTITNGTGTACYDATFTPYGQEMLNPNISQTCSSNYKFTGYEYDSESGLYYAHARYYNPRLGRFMSTDPLSGSTQYPQTQNRYAYVTNAPSCFTDPSGLGCPLVIAGTGDNPQNSQAIQNFANSIGAIVVYPLPNELSGFFTDATADYTPQGTSAVEQGIAAASGPDGSGPSSVITFSAGAGYYNAASSTATANIAYVMPYMPLGTNNYANGGLPYPGMQSDLTTPATGTQSTTVFTGTGFFNDLLQAIAPTVQGANYVNTGQKHTQNVFNNLKLPFNPGPKCKDQVTIVAGGGGGTFSPNPFEFQLGCLLMGLDANCNPKFTPMWHTM